MTKEATFVPYDDAVERSPEEMLERARAFAQDFGRRRSVRAFSEREVPAEVIKDCLRAANNAPSGANRQPWHFVVVSHKPLKKKIREEAEKEEHEFYHRRAPKEWLEALAPFGTDETKEFLEKAPYLIVIFSQRFGFAESGKKIRHYYVGESVGITTGVLISALHHAGLATLTHTPNPMSFLSRVLCRPTNEKPFLILATGYPAKGVQVPKIEKKPLEEVCTFEEGRLGTS